MTAGRLTRSALALSLVLAPLLGLAAAVALPALRSTRSAEVAAITADPGAFYIYALTLLLSSYLSVPAFFGIMVLLRQRAPRWSLLAGGLAQLGLLISIGDAATELMYWQMGAPGANQGQMVALADRYENAAGAATVYSVGGLALLVGTVLLTVGLWRTRTAPRWAALGLLVGTVANVVGFSIASRPVLIAGYVALLAAFIAMARLLLRAPADVGGPVATLRPLVADGERS
jgi:hypothetical protein